MAAARRAITLGEAGGGRFLDLEDASDKKFYMNGCKPLDGEPYDGKPLGLRLFLERLRGKASMYNWYNILLVPDLAIIPVYKNILDNYGSISLEECTLNATAYYTANDRPAQNAQMLYQCLLTSLTESALSKITMESKKYQVAGYQDGVCFLKVLLTKAKPDTVATVNMLRTSISQLKSKMIECDGNIVVFNDHVRSIESAMASYGERSDELLINTILAYEEVEDSDFVQYIKNKRSMWEEDKTKLDLDSLMTNSENKYNIAVQTGQWKAPTKEAEKFAAMKAEWQKNHGGNNNNNNSGSNNSSNSSKSKDKLSYAERQKKDIEANPWKIIAPGNNEPQVKVEKGTTFYWCATHKKWMGHSTAQCLGAGVHMRNHRNKGNNNVAYQVNNSNDSVSGTPSALTNPTLATPSVQVNNAMMSLAKNGYGLFE